MDTDISTAIILARGIVSENGENPEFDRGVLNLLAELYPVEGQPTDERMEDLAPALGVNLAAMSCAFCRAPMFITVRGHHHAENGVDVTR